MASVGCLWFTANASYGVLKVMVQLLYHFCLELYVIMVTSNSYSKSVETPVLCIHGTSWLDINDPVLMFFGCIKVILIYLSYLATCIPLLYTTLVKNAYW